MARRSPPRKVTYFEPVPPRLARNTIIESTFEVGCPLPLHDARRLWPARPRRGDPGGTRRMAAAHARAPRRRRASGLARWPQRGLSARRADNRSAPRGRRSITTARHEAFEAGVVVRFARERARSRRRQPHRPRRLGKLSSRTSPKCGCARISIPEFPASPAPRGSPELRPLRPRREGLAAAARLPARAVSAPIARPRAAGSKPMAR
jgi:hypothetical protein